MITLILAFLCIIPAILYTADQPLIHDNRDLYYESIVAQRIPAEDFPEEDQRRIAHFEAPYLAGIRQRNIRRATDVATLAQVFPRSLITLPNYIRSFEEEESASENSCCKECCRRLGSIGCNPNTLSMCCAFLPNLEKFIGGLLFIKAGNYIQDNPSLLFSKDMSGNSALIDYGCELCLSAASDTCLKTLIACWLCRSYTTDWYSWLAQDAMPVSVIREEFLAEYAISDDELLSDNEAEEEEYYEAPFDN